MVDQPSEPGSQPREVKRPWYRRPGCAIPLIVLVALFAFAGCINALSGQTNSTAPSSAAATTAHVAGTASTTRTAAAPTTTSSPEQAPSQAAPSQAPSEEPSPTEAEVPAEYRSALAKADQYANMMHMSKKGLYRQLISEYGEKFSKEAANYALKNVQTDWNANALAKAEQYQETMNMSPRAIRTQLTSSAGEQFTESEADYAMKNLAK